MPIRLTPHELAPRNGLRLWVAEVTPPDGGELPWRSPGPMTVGELTAALRAVGCSQALIDNALREASARYQQPIRDAEAEEEYGPTLRQALAGERDVPPQPPITEALIAYAFFIDGKAESLTSLADTADYLWRTVLTADEIAWAFLRLRQRGWLVIQGALYGLTAKAREIVAGITGQDGDRVDCIMRLEAWIADHPA